MDRNDPEFMEIMRKIDKQIDKKERNDYHGGIAVLGAVVFAGMMYWLGIDHWKTCLVVSGAVTALMLLVNPDKTSAWADRRNAKADEMNAKRRNQHR